MKKKIIAVMFVLALSICACGNPETGENSSEPAQSQTNDVETESEPSDEESEQEENDKLKEDTEAQIQEELKKAEEYYEKLDFEQVEACYDKLDELEYDTTRMRQILEYDKENFEDAKSCYETLKDAKEKLESNSYTSLSSLVGTLRETAAKIDAFPANTDSKVGKYISQIRNNNNYTMLQVQFLDSEDTNFDNEMSFAYAPLLETYVSSLVQEKFPYIDGGTDDNSEEQNSDYTVKDVLDELREMAADVGSKTDCVHVDPSYIPISGEPYYCLETTDSYLENSSSAGRPCDLKCRFLQSQSKKFSDFFFSLDFEEDLGFDILRVKVSDGRSELEIGQQYIENDYYSLYILSFNSKNSKIEDNKERAEQLHEMAAGQGEITFTLQGAEQEESIILTQEQKESVLYITEVWRNILNFY